MTGIRYVFLSYNNAYHIKRSSDKLRQLDAEGAVEPDGEGGGGTGISTVQAAPAGPGVRGR